MEVIFFCSVAIFHPAVQCSHCLDLCRCSRIFGIGPILFGVYYCPPSESTEHFYNNVINLFIFQPEKRKLLKCQSKTYVIIH